MAPIPKHWPKCHSKLLCDVQEAFARRGKAIGHRAIVSCTKEFTEAEIIVYERLNFDIDYLKQLFLRISCWEDGAVYVGINLRGSSKKKGWLFTSQKLGSINDISTIALVKMLESTINLPLVHTTDQMLDYRNSIDNIWYRLQNL